MMLKLRANGVFREIRVVTVREDWTEYIQEQSPAISSPYSVTTSSHQYDHNPFIPLFQAYPICGCRSISVLGVSSV